MNKKKVAIIIIIIVIAIIFVFKVINFCTESAYTEAGNKRMYILSTKISEDNYVLPAYSWGECLCNYVDISNIDIVNINIGNDFENYDFIEFDKQLNKNDFVLIQLGNIFEMPTKEDFDRINGLYKIYDKWIKDIKRKKAIPIIFTPNYINIDNNDSMNKYYNDFSEVAIKCAENNNIPIIDLKQITYEAFYEMEKNNGEQYTKPFYVIDEINENKIDKFSLSYCGGVFVSAFVAEKLVGIDSISQYMKPKILAEDLPKISRVEFVEQLLKIADIKPDNVNSVNKNNIYIETAINKGIIEDNKTENYSDEEISIEEACTIADKLLQYKGIVLSTEDVNPDLIKLLYKVNDYSLDSVRRFYSVARTGLNYEGYYLMSIYGVYDIVYSELN